MHTDNNGLSDRQAALSLSYNHNVSLLTEGPHVQRIGLHPEQVCTVQLPDSLRACNNQQARCCAIKYRGGGANNFKEGPLVSSDKIYFP